MKQGGVRQGAGMATLSLEHPDILDFMTAKDPDRKEGCWKCQACGYSECG